MTLDQRIADAARHVANGVVVPQVDLDAVRSQARANRRQRVVMAVTGVAAAIIVTGTALVMGRDASAPEPADPVDPAQLGGLPLTPFWHDGVLHVRGVEIDTPWRRAPSIEVAGDTVLAGPYGYRRVAPSWALVVGDRLEPVPIPDLYPRLSLDGRIVYWWTYPTADSTRVVTWDTETNRKLATRDLPGNDVDGGPRLYLAGIDADGMAYWVDEGHEIPVTRWDVRADTVKPMPGLRPSDVTDSDGRAGDIVGEFFQQQFVSPDGTKEVFDGDAPGDSDSPRLFRTTQLGVRPVGSEDPTDVVRLRIPETDLVGVLGQVWWETNETVLGVMVQGSGSDLMRCSIRDGACALVYDLNDGGGSDASRNWSFARFPPTE